MEMEMEEESKNEDENEDDEEAQSSSKMEMQPTYTTSRYEKEKAALNKKVRNISRRIIKNHYAEGEQKQKMQQVVI
jgi:type I restriction-modification system DNA methylase subunit